MSDWIELLKQGSKKKNKHENRTSDSSIFHSSWKFNSLIDQLELLIF